MTAPWDVRTTVSGTPVKSDQGQSGGNLTVIWLQQHYPGMSLSDAAARAAQDFGGTNGLQSIGLDMNQIQSLAGQSSIGDPLGVINHAVTAGMPQSASTLPFEQPKNGPDDINMSPGIPTASNIPNAAPTNGNLTAQNLDSSNADPRQTIMQSLQNFTQPAPQTNPLLQGLGTSLSNLSRNGGTPGPVAADNGGFGGIFTGIAKDVTNAVGNAANQDANAAQAATQPASVAYPTAPTISYHLNDFTGQANDMASKAYAPQYAALDTSIAQAKGDNANASKATDQQYAKLVAADATQKMATAKQYADAATAEKQAGSDLTGKVNANYNQAANDTAGVLAKLGIQAAAPDILAKNAGDQAFNTTEADKQTAAQQALMASQGQTQQDYQTNMASADQATGVAAQGALQQQLQDQLSGFSADRQNLAGQQSQQALSLAQNMQGQDLTLQQLQGQAQQQQYQDQFNQAQAQQQQNNSAASQALALLGQNQQNAQFQQQFGYTADQDAIKNYLSGQSLDQTAAQNAAQNALDQQKFQEQYNVDQINALNGYNSNAVAAGYNPVNQVGGQLTINPKTAASGQQAATGTAKFLQNAGAYGTTGNGVSIGGLVVQAFTQQVAATGQQPTDWNTYIQLVMKQAAANGATPSDMNSIISAAQDYWTGTLGNQQTPYGANSVLAGN